MIQGSVDRDWQGFALCFLDLEIGSDRIDLYRFKTNETLAYFRFSINLHDWVTFRD
jgi:hypothetical protein